MDKPYIFICAVDYGHIAEFFNFLSGKAQFRDVRNGSFGSHPLHQLKRRHRHRLQQGSTDPAASRADDRGHEMTGLNTSMNIILNFLLDRAKERSTWIGLIGFASSLGVAIQPEMVEAIASAGVALSAIVMVLTKDAAKKSA